MRPRILPPLLFFPPEIFSIMWFRLQRGFLLAFGWHFISSWVTSKMCAHMPDLRVPLQLHRNENGLAVHGTHEPGVLAICTTWSAPQISVISSNLLTPLGAIPA